MSGVGARSAPSLIEYLGDWRAPGIGGPRSQLALAPVGIRRAAAEVERRLGDLTPRAPTQYDLDLMELEVRRAWKNSGSLASVSVRSLRRTPWVLFRPHDQPDRSLAGVPGLLAAWLKWLEGDQRTRVLICLLREYIAGYPQHLPEFERLRSTLKQRIVMGASPRLVRWRERCARFGLLEAQAPSLLTSHWWGASVSFEEYATEAGLVPGLDTSSLVRLASERVLDVIEARLRSGHALAEWLRRGFEWLEGSGKLRFAELRPRLATALLSPFLDRAPEPAIQNVIQGFLLRVIGDPRSQRARWQGIPEHIRNVLFRWLVSVSLDDFFRVLDETAEDAHWKYRKAFWSAYLRKDEISDAWVVLGPAAGRIVRKEFDSQGGAGKLVLAEGVQSTHSVLLMRIRSLTIAEWSHSGRCWIWTDGNSKSPKLYETEYRRSHLRERGAWSKAHMGSETGRWQDDIARYIADETGVRVSRTDYMPKRKR